ncbi:hypothetical protein [Halovenus sp. HT40]|uniref:hypothetical protein n=1 Tax=Halovenus sp. HT40 TaxID=3126691 RepID=UPI00300F1A2C
MRTSENQSSLERRQNRIRLAVLVVLGFIWIVSVGVRPVAAGGDGASAGQSTDLLHVFIEIVQLLVGVIAIATAYLAIKTMRGGHIEWAFYSLTTGVVTFLTQRLWHSLHEFGFVPFPEGAEQTLFIVATVLMAIGFIQTYHVMQPTA